MKILIIRCPQALMQYKRKNKSDLECYQEDCLTVNSIFLKPNQAYDIINLTQDLSYQYCVIDQYVSQPMLTPALTFTKMGSNLPL